MNRETSFGQKVDAGWSIPELLDFYSLTEREYDRIIASLQEIRKTKK